MLAADAKGELAGDQHSDLGPGARHVADERRHVDDVLEVVEHEERAAGAQVVEDALVGFDPGDFGQPHRPRQRPHDLVGVQHVLQRHPPHGVEVLGRALGDLERQPSSCPSRRARTP